MQEDCPPQGPQHRPHEGVRALIPELVEDLVVVTWLDCGRWLAPFAWDIAPVLNEELHLGALLQIGQEVPRVVPYPRAGPEGSGDERDPQRA